VANVLWFVLASARRKRMYGEAGEVTNACSHGRQGLSAAKGLQPTAASSFPRRGLPLSGVVTRVIGPFVRSGSRVVLLRDLGGFFLLAND
jgi:hypothetical protein